ncbi:hypothetical protein PF005_g9619 [Phytophthora fragariae]|uniref:Uncharacterized protein n=1 Tax=Phytophthora fragariae TaxID=53985 RepID=A0A6A3YB10_9STRA|nr:hypothetical protein PF009_g30009 [Phytophthora fragariae]KAE9108695.1 hypothetical protein PF007_g12556 [Phytophthora fragariae]KAE9214956.1 hypothetical protein PF005_g9619 [Phytophthora fragariae]KAE9268446.1 hypothetical protein PF001_g29648 [Phytophthora fragariae]
MILGIFLSSSFSSFASSLAAAAISLVLENLPTLAWAYTTSAEVKRFEEELESVVSTAMEAETILRPQAEIQPVPVEEAPPPFSAPPPGLDQCLSSCSG